MTRRTDPPSRPTAKTRAPAGQPARSPESRTYRGYLHLDELLGAQHLVTDEPAELAFIVAHQATELWFKALLADLIAARDHLLAGAPGPAHELLRRGSAIERLLIHHLHALGQVLTPDQFGRIRPGLGQASGVESVQYRQIEHLSAPRRRQAGQRRTDPVLEPSLLEPSLWDAFVQALAATRRRPTSLDPLWRVARDLWAHDRNWVRWRTVHAQLATRYLGEAAGTGGTRGAAWLRATCTRHWYPPLWHLFADPTKGARP